MTTLEWANAVARFGLEICALAVLGYWGFWVTDIVVVELVLAILVPAVFTLTWAGLIPIGGIWMGAVADLSSAPLALEIGASVCLGYAVLTLARYRAA